MESAHEANSFLSSGTKVFPFRLDPLLWQAKDSWHFFLANHCHSAQVFRKPILVKLRLYYKISCLTAGTRRTIAIFPRLLNSGTLGHILKVTKLLPFIIQLQENTRGIFSPYTLYFVKSQNNFCDTTQYDSVIS